MPTFTVTNYVGATAKRVGALYIAPEFQVLDGSEGTALAQAGLHGSFVADLLSACLAHERCGVHLYRSVAGRTGDVTLQERYEAFGAETGEHVRILEKLVTDAGGDRHYVSPAARATEKAAAGLLESTYLLGGSIDPVAQELAMLEAVVLAEVKDHANWEFLAQLAAGMAAGEARDLFTTASAEVLAQEVEHYGWARDTRAQLLLNEATGFMLPAGDNGERLADATRDELLAQARELGVTGSSKMNKEELRDAIATAKGVSE